MAAERTGAFSGRDQHIFVSSLACDSQEQRLETVRNACMDEGGSETHCDCVVDGLLGEQLSVEEIELIARTAMEDVDEIGAADIERLRTAMLDVFERCSD